MSSKGASGSTDDTKSGDAVVRAIGSAAPAAEAVDLSAPELYLNREYTWIDFNRRVLALAQSQDSPLLERLKFLAIVGSNFDEFFMKRVGGLKSMVRAQLRERSIDGRTAKEQVVEAQARFAALVPEQEEVRREIMHGLAAHGVELVAPSRSR